MAVLDPRSLPYHADLSMLGPSLAAKFRALSPDRAVEDFVLQMAAHPHGFWQLQAARLLSSFLTAYDVHGALGLYQMHLLSSENFRDLLAGESRASMLDVGAGAGYVTEHARGLVSRISCTETSRPLARRLRARGFTVYEHDVSARPLGERFDVVACFNVLDRTSHPRRLLSALIEHLAPRGTILLSVPLPFRPHVHVAGGTVAPRERLPISADRFEIAARELSEQVLTKSGFAVERMARVPYLSRGDQHMPLYTLDAAVFVCRAMTDITGRT